MNANELADTAEHTPAASAQVPPPEPKSARVRVEIGSVSHVGLVRENNEDCYIVGRVERSFHTVATNLPAEYGPGRFDEVSYGFVVADGLGGSHAGETEGGVAFAHNKNVVIPARKLEMNRIFFSPWSKVYANTTFRYQLGKPSD